MDSRQRELPGPGACEEQKEDWTEVGVVVCDGTREIAQGQIMRGLSWAGPKEESAPLLLPNYLSSFHLLLSGGVHIINSPGSRVF